MLLINLRSLYPKHMRCTEQVEIAITWQFVVDSRYFPDAAADCSVACTSVFHSLTSVWGILLALLGYSLGTCSGIVHICYPVDLIAATGKWRVRASWCS